MRVFGQYEVVREIYRGAMGRVFIARERGGAGSATAAGARAVVKVCTPPVDVVGMAQSARIVAAFEAQTALMERVRAGAAEAKQPTRWVKVLWHGKCDGYALGDEWEGRESELPGAYVVMEEAAGGDLQRLIRSRVEMDAPTLRRLAGEIAEGLVQIRKFSGRGHGDLRGSNVLLLAEQSANAGTGSGKREKAAGQQADAEANGKDGAAELDRLSAHLCDPAPEWKSGDEEQEIKAFAELLHLLVTHKAYQGGWSGGQQQWGSLGASGSAWRRFIESVLDPSASSGDGRVAGYSVEDLPGVVDRISSSGGGKKRIIAGIAASIVLAGSIGGYFYWKHQNDIAKGRVVARWLVEPQAAQEWRAFCEEYREWFAFFLKRLDEKPSAAVLTAAQQSTATGNGGAATINTRRQLYLLDPELAEAVRALEAANVRAPGASRPDAPTDPWAIAGVSEGMDLLTLATVPTEEAKTDASIVATEKMRDVIANVRERLTTWHGPDVLKGAATEFNGQGWTRAGKYLESLAGRLGQGTGESTLSADVAGDIDAVVAVRPRVESIRARWKSVQGAIPAIEETEDPVLMKFGRAASKLVTGMDGEAGRASDLALLDQQLAKVEEQAKRLADFARDSWGGVDVEAFREGEVYARLLKENAPTLATFDEWTRTAASFPSLDPTLDPRRGWKVEESLTGIETLIQEFSGEPLEMPVDAATVQRATELRQSVAAASPKKLYWNRRNQTKIEAEATRLNEQTGTLKASLEKRKADRLTELAATARSVREGLGAKNSVVAGSPVIDGAWVKGRDALLASVPPERFKELTRRAEELERSLVAIDRALPAAVSAKELVEAAGGGGAVGGAGAMPEWATKIANAAVAERDRRIGAVLGDGPVDPARIATLEASALQAGQEFAGWGERVKSLGKQAAVLVGRLQEGYGPDETAAGGDASITAMAKRIADDETMRDAAVQGAIQPVLARVQQLREVIGEQSAAKLVGTLQNAASAQPEVVLAAWKRLGDFKGTWPGTDADLDAMVTARGAADRVVNAVPNAARKDELRRTLVVEQPQRMFASFVTTRKTAAEFEQAMGRAAGLGVEAAALPPEARYNAALLSLRKSLATNKPEDLGAYEAGRAFIGEMRAMSLSDARATALLSKLDQLTAERPGEVKKIDPKTLGPGSLGTWQATENPQTGGLTFTSSARRPVTIEFERVEADSAIGVDAFYIAKNEVSLGTLIGLLDTEPKRQQFQSSLAPFDDADPSWLGPRVWAWTAQGNAIVVGRAAEWLFTDPNVTRERPAFDPSLLGADYKQVSDAHGGNPSLDHPMQRISPGAAAFVARQAGCRLPTSAEWRAAYQAWIVNRGQTGSRWNLRDRTFELQRAHIQRMQEQVPRKASFQWPDVEIAPIDPSAPVGVKAQSGSGDDGILYFAPVTADQAPLRHLVGNVAEFVFDDAAAMETAPATVVGMSKMINSKPGMMKVVGGSALSPPSVPVDQAKNVDLLMAQDGFTDVGFRLVFGASGTAVKVEPLAMKINAVLTDDALILSK